MPDELIQVMKTCLRTSNQHLSTATLSALRPLIPLLVSRTVTSAYHIPSPSASSSTSSSSPSAFVDAATLRQVLNAFLPVGGLLERLGDKERSQVNARECLVTLGGFAFRLGAVSNMLSTGSKGARGPETPLAIFERYIREGGLGSKAWKVREQSILTLAHIRRKHHLFPIRPYLSLLIDALEDTDPHVRDCARQAVVELFSGPGVTDAARADLKKEMSKKNVRKTIVDSVLSKLLSASGSQSSLASHGGSENGDVNVKPKEYVPPSLALKQKAAPILRSVSHGSAKEVPRPASRAAAASPLPATPTADTALDVKAVYIASSKDLESEFASMEKPFEGKETEHNWAERERAIIRVRGMLKGDVHLRYLDTFLACLKEGFIQWSLKALASLRTTVATNACFLYSELAFALSGSLDPWCETLLMNLLKMSGFTKKITAQQSQVSVTSLITYTSGTPRVFIPLICQGVQDKNVQTRSFTVSHLKTYLEVHGHRSKHIIESSGLLDAIEKALKKSINDTNPGVREAGRSCFWVFDRVWRERALAILNSLDSTARKQLEKSCPDPDLVASLPVSTPQAAKKSSVAAAIAASRAKAKAIAAAPPTLRHQATSSSAVTPGRRPGSPAQKVTPARPSSPQRTASASPPSTKFRVLNNGTGNRSVSTSNVPSHSRTLSGGRPMTPPSPEQSSFHRRTSSPLASPSRLQSKSAEKVVQSSRDLPRVSRINAQLPRDSAMFPESYESQDSLLLAQTIPIPEGDSDSEHSAQQVLSFSAALEQHARSNSQAHSFSPKSVDSRPMPITHALSSDSIADLVQADQPIVEDALRARAEQAESAAERLLELNEPEDESHHIPPSLLVGSNGATNGTNGMTPVKAKAKPSPLPIGHSPALGTVTPLNRGSAILRQAALFKDSPAYSGRTPSLLDVLHDRNHESAWWLKRKALISRRPKETESSSSPLQDLPDLISKLATNTVTVEVLEQLIFLSRGNPAVDAISPLSPEFGFPSSPSPFVSSSTSLPSGVSELWETNRNFDRLFNALIQFLDPSKPEKELEYGLILLWELIENQGSYIEGREADVFSLLLQIRYCNKVNVLEATNTIRDALTTRIEPVYGLTTMHASLRTFNSQETPPNATAEVKSSTYAFGLIALGKFILRLPPEVAEEELPRMRGTLIAALNDKTSLVVRESAAAAIISAQLVLRDETQLFTLLDGLADEKKNLLTYLFDKHGVRGQAVGSIGMDRLEKEMRRLDTRTSTPPRP